MFTTSVSCSAEHPSHACYSIINKNIKQAKFQIKSEKSDFLMFFSIFALFSRVFCVVFVKSVLDMAYAFVVDCDYVESYIRTADVFLRQI